MYLYFDNMFELLKVESEIMVMMCISEIRLKKYLERLLARYPVLKDGEQAIVDAL